MQLFVQNCRRRFFHLCALLSCIPPVSTFVRNDASEFSLMLYFPGFCLLTRCLSKYTLARARETMSCPLSLSFRRLLPQTAVAQSRLLGFTAGTFVVYRKFVFRTVYERPHEETYIKRRPRITDCSIVSSLSCTLLT